jgi:hypothetical protein
MTGDAGESLVEAVEEAMEHYRDHIEFEADAIEACAEDWDASDGDNKSGFDKIGADLSGFVVPRISGGAGTGL